MNIVQRQLWSTNDGHDYVPTNKWVTFGHHFAAIAGAGPSCISCYRSPVRVFTWCIMDPYRFLY